MAIETSMSFICPEQLSDTIISPLTLTTNTLEALLKKCDEASLLTDPVERSLDSTL